MENTQVKDRAETHVADMADASTAGQEVVVHDGGQQQGGLPDGPRTIAQERKAKLERVVDELEKRATDYIPLLEAHGINWFVFVAVLKQALIKVPSLLECSTASLLQAAYRCAADGLMPDGDEAAITPFKKTATYVPGYKGMLKCAYAVEDGRGQKVYRDIDLDVVYDGEEGFLKYRKGTDPFLSFEPPLNRRIDAKVVGAYCVVRTNNGGIFIEIISEQELAKIASVNKASNGPRATWAAEMHKKGPLRRVLKRTPRDQRLVQMLRHDEDAYIGDTARAVDGDDIPTDKLFDDTPHRPDAEESLHARQDTDDDGREIVMTARADLMACETEDQLTEIVAKIKGATSKAKKPKPDHFTEAERDELVQNAEQLRAHRWPKDQSHEADQAGGEEVAGEILAEVSETLEVRPVETVGAAPGDNFVQVGAEAGEAARPPAEAQPSQASAQPAASAAAAPASEPSQRPSDSSTTATTAGPAGGATSASPTEEGFKVSAVNNYGGFEMAPTEGRMTAAEAELADPALGVHFKRGIVPDGGGKQPMFDGKDRIVGWAAPDRNIPWRDFSPPGAAPAAAAPAVEPAAVEPQQDDDDGSGYGDAAPPATVEGVTYFLRISPKVDPKEFKDPVEWRDAMLWKMNAIKPEVAQLWWADNRQYVVDAMATAKAQAGRCAVVAVAKGWKGAKEIVDQFGPF